MAIHTPVELGTFENPFDFLAAVMNHSCVKLEQRMLAAKILAQVSAPARRKEIVYKSRDAALLDSVSKDNVFSNAVMAAPQA